MHDARARARARAPSELGYNWSGSNFGLGSEVCS